MFIYILLHIKPTHVLRVLNKTVHVTLDLILAYFTSRIKHYFGEDK